MSKKRRSILRLFSIIILPTIILSIFISNFVFAEDADYAYIIPQSIQKYPDIQIEQFKKAGDTYAFKKDIKLAKQLFNNIAVKYSVNDLTAKSQYMVGETSYLQALALKKKPSSVVSNKTKNASFNKAIAEYEKVLSLTDNAFLRNNVLYRITECYYAQDRFVDIFAIGEGESFGYLDPDMLYLLGIAHLRNTAGKKLSKEKCELVQTIFQDLAEINVGKDEVLFALGLTFFVQGDYETALAEFSDIQTDDSRYFAGKCYEQLGKYLLAAGEYKSLLLEYPNSKYIEKSKYSIAETLYDSKDFNQAITKYKEFYREYPKSVLSYYARYKVGCSYFELKKYDVSISYFKTILGFANTPKEVAVLSQYLLGESYYNIGDTYNAIENYKKCALKYPYTDESNISRFMIGWCYYSIKKYQQAEYALAGALDVIPENHILYYYSYFLLGNALYMQKKYEDALVSYQTLGDKCTLYELSELRDAAFSMTNLISYKLKDYTRIATEYHYVLRRLMPTPEGSVWRVRTYFIVGDACYRLGYVDLARRLFEDVASAYSKDDYIYTYALDNLAWCAFKEGEYGKARSIRDEISDIVQNSSEKLSDIEKRNYFELGNIYFNQKEYMDALESYETFIEVSGNDSNIPMTMYRLGICYYRLEYYSNAIDMWKKIVKTYPRSEVAAISAYKIADTYFKAGKYYDAVKEYRFIAAAYKNKKSGYKVKESFLRIGQSYFNAKNYNSAITAFKNFILKYPKDKDAKTALDGIESSLYRKKEKMIIEGKIKSKTIKIAPDMDLLFKSVGRTASTANILDEATFRIAKNYYDEDNYFKAIQKFRAFFNNGSYDVGVSTKIANAQFYLAESYFLSKKYAESANAFKVLINNFPKNENIPLAYFRLGSVSFKIKKYTDAVNAYTKLIAMYPDLEYAKMAQYNLGLAYKSAEKLDEAAIEFVNYYRKNPYDKNSVDLMIDAGDIYSKQREYENAIDVYQAIFDMVNNETAINLQYKIAECYAKLDNEERAVKEYEKLMYMSPVSDNVRLRGLVSLAEIYEKDKDTYKAVSVYEEILSTTDNKQWVTAIKARLEALEN